jgi:glycosyltransferase involved in cell wall biosynthesis
MIKVGITELHGIAREVMANPPAGVEYVEVQDKKTLLEFFIHSPAKGVLHYFEGSDCDILEAPLFPILTNKPWVYTPARFSGATSFNFLGISIPPKIKVFLIRKLFERDNFIKLVFKSHAGALTLKSYAKITDPEFLEKVEVVYPCMRRVDDSLIKYNDGIVNFLFSGDFFLKGGASVLDAFELLQKEYSHIRLRICSSPELRIKNTKLKELYSKKIKKNKDVVFGPVDRNEMLGGILPESDIFVSPTFQEAFGFAILEASAYGLPVISTNHFAIPEIIEKNVSGFLIDTEHFDFIRYGKVCVLDDIPGDFHEYMTKEVYSYMRYFIENPSEIEVMGKAGLEIARSKFSFENRNKKMKKIYEEGLKGLKK